MTWNSVTSENLKQIPKRSRVFSSFSGSFVTKSRSASLKPTEAMTSSLAGRSSALAAGGTAAAAADENDARSARTVRRLKTAIVTFFLLTAVGVAAAFSVYRNHASRTARERFVEKFRQDSASMLAMLGTAIDSTLASTDAFAVSMLSEARSTNQTWPYVTIGDYNVRATKLMRNAGAKFVTTYAVVEEEDREAWEEYASGHTGWIGESLAVQARNHRGYSGPNITKGFLEDNYMGHYDLIHGYDEFFFCGNSTDGVDHGGPYLPLWQHTPVIPIYPLYNWCVASRCRVVVASLSRQNSTTSS